MTQTGSWLTSVAALLAHPAILHFHVMSLRVYIERTYRRRKWVQHRSATSAHLQRLLLLKANQRDLARHTSSWRAQCSRAALQACVSLEVLKGGCQRLIQHRLKANKAYRLVPCATRFNHPVQRADFLLRVWWTLASRTFHTMTSNTMVQSAQKK